MTIRAEAEKLQLIAFESFVKFALTSDAEAAHKIRDEMHEVVVLPTGGGTRESFLASLAWLRDTYWGVPVDVEKLCDQNKGVA